MLFHRVLRISFVCTLFVWSSYKELSLVVNINSLLAGVPANMVRGSGPDSGADDKSKRMYDGKLDSWPSAKIKLKSLLYRTGLWDVTQGGVSFYSDTHAHANAESLASEQEGEYFYSLRDVDVNGPCCGKTILDIVKILSSSGHISPETIYIYHASTTRGDWEPWSPGLINKIAIDSALISGMRDRAFRQQLPTSPRRHPRYLCLPAPAAPCALSTSDHPAPPPRRGTAR